MLRIRLAPLVLLFGLLLVACSDSTDPTRVLPAPTSTPFVLQLPTPTASTPVAAAPAEAVAPEPTVEQPAPVVVATDNSAEQQIIGKLIVTLLQANNIPIVDQTGMANAPAVRAALERGEVDVMLALSGFTLATVQNLPPASLPADAARSYQLAKTLDEPNGLVWLKAADFNATPVLLVDEPLGDAGVRTVQNLADYAATNRIRLCVPADVTDATLRGLLSTYELQIAAEDIVSTPVGEALSSLRRGECRVAVGHLTDGRIGAWSLSPVLDNLGYFPINVLAPVVRADTLLQYPEMEPLLADLFDILSGRTVQYLSMQRLIGADGVFNSGDERSPENVAQRFLAASGLLKSAGAVRVGAVAEPGDDLLGALLAAGLAESGVEVEVRTFDDAANLREALRQGTVDIAWDEPAAALVNAHNIPTAALPTEANEAYRLVQTLDQSYYDLVWLASAPFNAGDSLFAADLALATIDDVAAVLARGQVLRFCVPPEKRDVLLASWTAVYGDQISAEMLVPTAADDVLPAINTDLCDVGLSFTTNPQATEFSVRRLADTSRLLRAATVAPVVRQSALWQHLQMGATASTISALLTEAAFGTLQTEQVLGTDGVRATGDELSAPEVADQFLAATRAQRNRPNVVIGAQNFTETLLLAEMTRRVFLEAGFDAVELQIIDGSVEAQYAALASGAVDVTWIYLGAALQVMHGDLRPPSDSALARQQLTQLDKDALHRWLQPTRFNNTFTLLTNPARLAIEPPLRTIDDLAAYMNANGAPLSICLEEDFFKRPDGLQALQAEYQFKFDEELIRLVPFAELADRLAAGECDVAEGLRTDGRIEAAGFRSLTDSRQFFAAYHAAPAVQAELFDTWPEIDEMLAQLALVLTDEAMMALNALADYGLDARPESRDEEPIGIVAALFLCEQQIVRYACFD